MHNNIILISYEDASNTMFEEPITEPISQMPELPSAPPSELPSEMEYVAGKSFVSFGIMLGAILLISFILLMIKKRRKAQLNNGEDLNQLPPEIKEVKDTNQQKEAEESIPQPRPLTKKIKNENLNKLNTPSSIKLCIRKFLEKTK